MAMKKLILGILLAGFLAGASVHADRYDRRWHQAHWGEGHWSHDRHRGCASRTLIHLKCSFR